jgi:hypothetical protein
MVKISLKENLNADVLKLSRKRGWKVSKISIPLTPESKQRILEIDDFLARMKEYETASRKARIVVGKDNYRYSDSRSVYYSPA